MFLMKTVKNAKVKADRDETAESRMSGSIRFSVLKGFIFSQSNND